MKEPSRFRLNLTLPVVRNLLEEYKKTNGIPPYVGLNDSQRGNFEVWAIITGRQRNIDVFGTDEYLESIIRTNNNIIRRRENKL